MIPDDSKRHEWMVIVVWSLACLVAALFGGLFHAAACGCAQEYPPSEPPYVVTCTDGGCDDITEEPPQQDLRGPDPCFMPPKPCNVDGTSGGFPPPPVQQ